MTRIHFELLYLLLAVPVFAFYMCYRWANMFGHITLGEVLMNTLVFWMAPIFAIVDSYNGLLRLFNKPDGWPLTMSVWHRKD